MKIAVVGIGYVGLSLATLLSQNNEVVAVDVLPGKVEMINNRKPTIKDKEIQDFFKNRNLNLRATLDHNDAFKNSKYIVICTPTNYNEDDNCFDTFAVEDIVKKNKKNEYIYYDYYKVNCSSRIYRKYKEKI